VFFVGHSHPPLTTTIGAIVRSRTNENGRRRLPPHQVSRGRDSSAAILRVSLDKHSGIRHSVVETPCVWMRIVHWHCRPTAVELFHLPIDEEQPWFTRTLVNKAAMLGSLRWKRASNRRFFRYAATWCTAYRESATQTTTRRVPRATRARSTTWAHRPRSW